MKKTISILLAAALVGGMITIPAAAEESDGATIDTNIEDYENNEVLVMYDNGDIQVFTYDDKDGLTAGLNELAEDDSVAVIQPNYSYSATALSVNDELLSEQWALDNDGSFHMEEEQNDYPVFDDPFSEPSMPGSWQMPDGFGNAGGGYGRVGRFGTTSTASSVSAAAGIDINAEEAWSIYDGGTRDVTIAVIDTGIDYTHSELSDSIWINTDEIAGNGKDDDGNGYIDDVYGWNFFNNNNNIYTGEEDSHGTHCAGTIAAKANNGEGIAGIVQSDKVKIMSVKALGGTDGSGTTASIIRAIQYAEDNGASICNLSLGTSENDLSLYSAIANSDMLFVVAAGNDGTDTDVTPCYPASYDLDNIISVANINYDGELHYSSDYGKTSVDIAAPGSYILSTTPEGTYSYMTGTSMSAPMVTAGAAMVCSYFGDITLADVKEILLSSSKKIDSLTDTTVSGGMLDLGAALSYDLSTLSGTQWEKPENVTQTNETIYFFGGMGPRQGQRGRMRRR